MILLSYMGWHHPWAMGQVFFVFLRVAEFGGFTSIAGEKEEKAQPSHCPNGNARGRLTVGLFVADV
jgi:hypothetical protein